MARILIIDDDKTFSTLLGEGLRKAGHTIDLAYDGREGSQRIATTRYDAVVTDIIMPDQEGIETIRLIRRRHPKLPIVAMSGGSATLALDLLQIARALGANDAIAKPFRPSELLARLEPLLAQAAPTAAAAD